MNKKCSSCGVEVPATAKFCQNCGGSNFVENTPPQQVPQGNFNPGNQPGFAPNPYQQPYGNQSFQTPPPKKKKTGLIIGIVAGVLLVLGMIGSFAQNYLQSRDYDDDYDENNDYDLEDILEEKEEEKEENVPAPIPYSKGAFDGSVYVNEWADIKLALPSGFSNGDESLYSSAENDSTDCGAYFVADDTMSLMYICYEKLPTFPIYTEEQYMDAAMKSLKSITSITYNTPDTYSQITIGGYNYTKAVCSFKNDYGDFYNTIYVRKIDNYIAFISVAGISPEANDALASQITTAK